MSNKQTISKPMKESKEIKGGRKDPPKTERPDIKPTPLKVDNIQDDEPRKYTLTRPSKLVGGGVVTEEVDFETWVYEVVGNMNRILNSMARASRAVPVPKSLLQNFKGTPQ